jgi:VWFA-related protein
MKRSGLLMGAALALLGLGGGSSLAQPGKPAAPAPAPAGKAAAAAPARPGAAPAAEDSGFIESVTVNVVSVDVFVTDKKTHAYVPGLTRNDFELYEDGRPMAITNFYAVVGGRPTQGAESPPAEAPATAPPIEPGRAPVPEDQRLRLVVYIDNFNLKPFDRNRVMRNIRVFLDQKLHREDQVMLVTYDRSLHFRHGFTSDPALINNELVEIEKISAQAVHSESDRREVLRQIDEAQGPDEASGYARAYAGSAYNDLEASVDAMKTVITTLAGIPGRKAVLYVSDGLPMIAGYDVFYAIQEKFKNRGSTSSLTEMMQYDGSRRFSELASQANANRITFYTIDAGGLRVYASTTAENATAGQGVYIDELNIQNMQSPLQMLAEQTGGTAVINANDVGPSLDRIAYDFNSFYSLGYTPPHNGDGRYHKITVKLKRKGLELRHRAGYRDKSPETRMNDGTLAALQFPFESNPMGARLEFGTVTRRQDGFYIVPVSIKIPLSKLLLVPRPNSHEGRVRLFIAAMDQDGGTSEVQQAPLPISIPLADLPKIVGKYYTYQVSLLMRNGAQKVAVGVRDEVASQESFVTGGLRVGT